MTWPLIEKTQLVDELGWFKVSYKKCSIYYPCRTCKDDEVKFFFTDDRDGKIVVRCLGWKLKHTGTYELIAETKWVPWKSGKDAEEKLDNYLKAYRSELKEDPVAIRTEELAIRSMWKLVQERGTAEVVKGEEPVEQAAEVVLSGTVLESLNRAKRIVSQSDVDSQALSSSVEDGSDLDDIDLASPRSKKKQNLRTGDVIEYYDPIGVAGKDEWKRQTTIVGIDARHKTLPLNLADGESLDKDHPIRIIGRRLRGKLVAHNGTFKIIREYSLKSGGTSQLVGFQRWATKAKEIRRAHQEEVEAFWEQKEGEPAKVPTTAQGNENRKRHQSGLLTSSSRFDREDTMTRKKQRQRKSEVDKETKKTPSVCPIEEIKKEVKAQIGDVKNAMVKKRYRPHMKVEQLEFVLQIWTKLAKKEGTIQEKISDIALQLDLTARKLTFFLTGDKKKGLSEVQIEDINQRLSEWIDEDEN